MMANPAAAPYRANNISGARRVRRAPRPGMGAATFVLLVGLIVTYLNAASQQSVTPIFSSAAVGLLGTLALSFLIDSKGAFVRIIRMDIFMLVALYGLTFFEFLFEQPPLMGISVESARTALLASFLGFAGIAVGRHIVSMRRSLPPPQSLGFSPKLIFTLLLLSTALGYFYMLLSVSFNPIEMVEQMLRPRFTQPWSRGRLGGPSALLAELSLMKAAVPALCGLVLAQRARFSTARVTFALLIGAFVLFDGYSSGTRNVFLLYFITFLAAYFLYAKRMSTLKLLGIGTACAIIAFGAMLTMLQTRTNVGVTTIQMEFDEPVFIDMNLVNVARLTEVFPERAAYLGLEIPFNMIIRPIPRVLWPDKPEGLSLGIEEALGVGDYMTLSATFIGEFWMAGGMLAVAFGALCLGALAGAWNRYGSRADTQIKLLTYLVGFYPAGLCMRSFLSVAPALLPIFALLIFTRMTRKKDSRKNLYKIDQV